MQYILLIYTEESSVEPPADQMAGQLGAYQALTDSLRANGALVAGEALHPSTTATTVRVRGGQTLTTDGPFAETKEVLGGFYLVHAADLDEAIAYAARIPGAQHGSIEVRPILEWNADGSRSELATAGAGAA